MLEWDARWIWHGDPLPRNSYLCARKEFEVPEDLEKARIRITADSRYFLFINGERVGNGPIRGWHSSWPYDTYEILPYLRRGQRNALAVLVVQPGETNFQYPLGRGGLLAQIDMERRDGERISIGTDRTWRMRYNPAYDRRTPRISCQQGFVEHYDATKEIKGWTSPGFDDMDWALAEELGGIGTEPWTGLSPRSIPFLTSEPVYPVRVVHARTVLWPRIVHTMDLRPNLIPGDRLSNPRDITGLVVTVVNASKDMDASITSVNNFGLGPGRVRVNGAYMDVREGKAIARLRKGENLVVFDVSGTYHDWWFTTVWDPGENGIDFGRPVEGVETAWATAGPFASKREEGFWNVWEASSISEIRTMLKPILPEYLGSDHLFAKIVLAKGLAERPRIENLEAILRPNDEFAVIYPPEEGEIEILLDFGKELVGFWDFEMEAPEGTILGLYGFEAMHPNEEGGWDIQHTWGLNNVLKYISRDGWQRYTSITRHGFRYMILSIHFPEGERRPVRIRSIRCILNTYPYEGRGDFSCDDWKLNKIWEMCGYTLRLCSEDTYVDCPAYEQTFWVGDARNEALISYATYGGYDLARRCWILAGESLQRSPLVESQVPSGWQNILTAWSLLWVWACEEHYRFTGDMDFLRSAYPLVARQMRNIGDGFVRPDGLFEIEAWNMLDWAPMDTPGKGVVTHQNAMLVEAYRRASKMARWLDMEEDARYFDEMAERVKEAINRYLWDDEIKAYVDAIHPDGSKSKTFSVQTQTMIYLCKAATKEREEIIREYVYGRPEGFVWFGSPFALFFLLECYAKDGRIDKMLEVIRKEWGAMVDYGATTAWEILSPRTRSHCHAWSAAPAFFLTCCVLGIRPLETDEGIGLKHVLIAPEPCDLRWARGRFPTPNGDVEARWEREEGSFRIWVRMPDGVKGEILLPGSVPEDARVEMAARKGCISYDLREGRHVFGISEGAQAWAVARW